MASSRISILGAAVDGGEQEEVRSFPEANVA